MSRPATIKIGDEFGSLKVEEDLGIQGGKNRRYLCRCKCGKMHAVVGYALKSGDIQSCGCSKKDCENSGRFQARHGESSPGRKSLTYRRWLSMKRRVRHRVDYKGVEIDPRWAASYEAFRCDMGECPGPEYTVDREDNSQGYKPGNCRWATVKQQMNNRRCNVRVKTGDGFDGTVAELCDRHGVPVEKRCTVYRRLARGVPPEKAVLF